MEYVLEKAITSIVVYLTKEYIALTVEVKGTVNFILNAHEKLNSRSITIFPIDGSTII